MEAQEEQEHEEEDEDEEEEEEGEGEDESIDDRENSIQKKFHQFLNRKKVVEQCTKKSLGRLHEAYMETDGEEMDETQLYDAFENILKIPMAKDDFRLLFKRMDSMRDKKITWDEFVSFLLLEFRVKEIGYTKAQLLELPLTGFPVIIKPRHRSAICRILFCPEMNSHFRTTSFYRGCYLTASKDGIINYWSLDFVYQRSVKSVNPNLKVRSTLVTDMIAMPDVQIICTSSAERDLRFYDTAASKFDLRVRITSLKDAVVCMGYHFSESLQEDCYIVLGDTGGSIKVISFSPIDKGPFKQLPKRELLEVNYETVLRGDIEGFTITEFNDVHSDWVRQVDYYGILRGFISCSKCSKCSLLLSDPTGTKMKYEFKVNLGISCFTFCKENQLLMTGGPDCLIRLWNPFVPKKASAVLRGHRTPISVVVMKHSGELGFSLSKDRCIKVWDIAFQNCIQTYNNLPSEVSERTPMSVIYNPVTQKLIIASMAVAILTCEKVIDEEISDGESHVGKITCVLYNPLFKVIVSTSTDSCIIVWEPWLGRRLHCITNAHTGTSLGEFVLIEITSAAFDFSNQLLITGGRDGSLKVWSFSSGTCIKNMSIEHQSEITGIIWLKNRILCAGWNRYITEFADTETGIYRKPWEKRHTDDILCAAVRFPDALVTASYNGELILWRLETGQPYKYYQVMNPTESYKIVYGKKKYNTQPKMKEGNNDKNIKKNIDEWTIEKSTEPLPHIIPIRAVLFLCSRKMDPNTGTLLVSLDSGFVQIWSHHPSGGFIDAFKVIHVLRDRCLSLATDPENHFLITGHAKGYIKVWLLKNYALPEPLPKISMPALRVEFPFLWKDRIPGRAKRAVKNQSFPLLLSSVMGHSESVSAVQFIPGAKIIVSGSFDHTVRLWTLGGRYIGTFGTYRNWRTLIPNVPASEYLKEYRLPPEIKRSGSSTTIKVLRGGCIGANFDDGLEIETTKEVAASDRKFLYGERLTEPILGRFHEEVPRPKIGEKAKLDNSLAYIPVYKHLKTHDITFITK